MSCCFCFKHTFCCHSDMTDESETDEKNGFPTDDFIERKQYTVPCPVHSRLKSDIEMSNLSRVSAKCNASSERLLDIQNRLTDSAPERVIETKTIESVRTLQYDDLKYSISVDDYQMIPFCFRAEGNQNLAMMLPAAKLVFRYKKHSCRERIPISREREHMVTSVLYQFLIKYTVFNGAYITVPVILEVPEEVLEDTNMNIYSKRRADRRSDKWIVFNGVEVLPDYCLMWNQFPDPAIPSTSTVTGATGTVTGTVTGDQTDDDTVGVGTSDRSVDWISADNLELEYGKTGFAKDYLRFLEVIQSSLFDSKMYDDYIKSVHAKPPITTYEKYKLMKEEAVLSVEIKPKQGWLAPPDRRFGRCTFCLQQYLKMQDQSVLDRSCYCPMNIFSGDLNRMTFAVMSLLKTPQNNLKLFKDGVLVLDGDHWIDLTKLLHTWFGESPEGNIDKEWCYLNFSQMIVDALLAEFGEGEDITKSVFRVEPYEKTRDHEVCSPRIMVELETHFENFRERCDFKDAGNLPQNCVLGRIKSMQQLDQVGIETCYDYYESHELDQTGDYEYVKKLVSGITQKDNITEVPTLNVLEAYLLAAAARDMSIFITFKRVYEIPLEMPANMIMDNKGGLFKFTLAVGDVGPKPLSTIDKQWRRDGNIIKACYAYFYPDRTHSVE